MTDKTDNRLAFHVIAIDGGAASGKSSTSSRLAGELNLLHVDTGSHYRAVTYACLKAGVPATDGVNLRRCLSSLSLETIINGRSSVITFNGEAPPSPELLRAEEVNRHVSQFAALPVVREAVKAYQRGQVQIARRHGFNGVVMDGRDIGTVILPDADLKIFLTADEATRQKRRELEGAADTIADRDKRDSSRTTAPLRPADDAVVIDNSTLSLEEVVDKIRQLVQR